MTFFSVKKFKKNQHNFFNIFLIHRLNGKIILNLHTKVENPVYEPRS
jgi:hypothetical protein